MDPDDRNLADPERLMPLIRRALWAHAEGTPIFDTAAADLAAASAVLLLLGRYAGAGDAPAGEICLILNKRSARVRQPGDLCCPGGSVSPRFDYFVARLLGMPFFPLQRWPCWPRFRRERPLEARWLRLYLATGLRESFEEMRLNPLRAHFLGPLPHHRLVLFRRLIYPLVAWVPHQRRFRLNREVQRIVRVPLRSLLDPSRYICYRLSMEPVPGAGSIADTSDHPGFRLSGAHNGELLWGATYRIATGFLKAVFDFTPPPLSALPVIDGRLGWGYLTGERP
jgi:hypothetical protein